MINSYNNEVELDKAEKYYIEYFESNNPTIGYNIAVGGRNSRGVSGKNHYNYGKPSYNRGKSESEKQKHKISKSLKETYRKYGKNKWSEKQRENFYNALNNRTEERKEEIRIKMSTCMKGKNLGKIKVEKESTIKKIKPEELDKYIKDGWTRKIKEPKVVRGNNGKRWINKDGINKFVYVEELYNFINNGWSLGMIKNWKPNEEQRCKMSIAQKNRFKNNSVWNKGLTREEMLNYGKNRLTIRKENYK